MPKEHHAYFERIKEEDKELLAEALQVSLNKLFKGMNDPAYNFFLHTAPVDGKDYNHYHWHLEILPKTSTWAGFELGTGIEISTVEPEAAAEYLRKIE
jgi:UDPglucose--hexose-1-phosphate uridylyltransferase